MPPIIVRALGTSGVNVDTDPLLLQETELRDAQNLVQETSDAHFGGVHTRPGLAAFTTAPLSGPVLGGIGMAVKGVAQASGAGGGPGTGGDDPGDGGGPGEPTGTGDPGGGGGNPTGPFNPTGPLFGGARLIVIGRENNATAASNGDSWFITSENFADVAIVSTGPPGPPNVWDPTVTRGPDDFAVGAPAAGAVLGDFLYYFAGITNVTGNQRPTIRRTNGLVDELCVTVPKNSTAVTPTGVIGGNQACLSMMAADGALWFTEATVFGATGGTSRTRLFKLDPDINRLTHCPMPTHFDTSLGTSGPIAYALGFYNGHVYVGEYSAATTGSAWLQALLPTETGAVEAGISLAFNAPENVIGCIQDFDGSLFVGAGISTGATGAFANIHQMLFTQSGVLSAVNLFPGDAGATGADGQFFPSMRIFKSALYASYFNPSAGAKIYKFDGTSWSTVYTASGAFIRPYFLFVDKNTMYAIGVGDGVSAVSKYLITADGSNWTDKTANIGTGTGSIVGFPLLFGFEQTGAA